MKQLFEAQSSMERDALVARLQDAGINCQAEHRDLSRRITNNTVDLSYEGVSAVQSGFKISVLDEDFEQAQKVVAGFRRQMELPNLKIAAPVVRFDKFYSASLFSLVLFMVPITLPLAFYHLFCAIKAGEKISVLKLLFALTILATLGGFLLFVLYNRYK